MHLSDIEILALDCQATGATPSKGQLLEMGWAPFCPGGPIRAAPLAVESFLIQLPPAIHIPAAVRRITGITDAAMADAVQEDHVWRRLLDAARAVAARNQMPLCPTVIHFAGFERPFLESLHHTHAPETPFAFQIVCTHAIAVRLLPDLPRRGLRALSGYFGHGAPEMRRSADHVRATVTIWQNLIPLLQDACSVNTFAQLMDWLAHTPPPKRTKRAFPMPPEVRKQLPASPGIYRMKRADREILYIGKAKSLKHRVNSYFRSKAAHAEHILEMLTQARHLDYSVTDTALAAAVQESDEIKRVRPPYNIALKTADRRLIFLDRALSGYSASCDNAFPVGPIPHDRQIDGFIACVHWIFGDIPITGDIARDICDHLFLWHVPDQECLRDGVELFRNRHRHLIEKRSALGIVTAIGANAWRRCLADSVHEKQNENGSCADDDEASNAIPLNERDWTPEEIAGAIEGILMRTAYLIRRARWFCLLSESCLAWAAAEDPALLKNLVIFEGGAIRSSGNLSPGKQLPQPPGYRRPFPERRRGLDIAAYDRMRVVTTELRRLLGENRVIHLKFWPNRVLGPPALRKVLEWV